MERRITPEEKYHLDSQFHSLVDLIESFLTEARYSPSELREAVMLASINYELKRPVVVHLTEQEYNNWRAEKQKQQENDNKRIVIECAANGAFAPEGE